MARIFGFQRVPRFTIFLVSAPLARPFRSLCLCFPTVVPSRERWFASLY